MIWVLKFVSDLKIEYSQYTENASQKLQWKEISSKKSYAVIKFDSVHTNVLLPILIFFIALTFQIEGMFGIRHMLMSDTNMCDYIQLPSIFQIIISVVYSCPVSLFVSMLHS